MDPEIVYVLKVYVRKVILQSLPRLSGNNHYLIHLFFIYFIIYTSK